MQVAEETAPPRTSPTTATAAVLVGWLALVGVTHVWGEALLSSGMVLRLATPPLVGREDLYVTPMAVVPVLVGSGLVLVAPRLVAGLSWRRVLLASVAMAALWAVALALTRGGAGLTEPLLLRTDEYLLQVPDVRTPAEFLSTFTDRISSYRVHVRGHPPGMVLIFWCLEQIGLGGAWWGALLCIGGGASAVAAVLVSVRELAGEATARRAAPFVAIAPLAVWVATTADALYAGIGAWSATALVLAMGRQGRRSDALALAGGFGFGVLLMLSYGLTLLGLIPLAVAVHRRRLRPLVLAALPAAAVLGAFALAGFWWFDGYQATLGEYRRSAARDRPYGYFFVSNVAAAAIAVGPAVVVALTRVRGRRLWLCLAGPLLAMVAANISGLSKGEVERIWLPFTIWVLAAGAALVPGGHTRRWLAVQVALAIAIQLGIRTRW